MPVSALAPSPAAFRRALLTWYKRSGRHDLPWRGDFDPYHVLLSEYMLQQTGVSTVIPYFHRFLKEFPTLGHLARSTEERVLELWAGLGYYARARSLRRAAERMVKEFNGRIPETRDACESLPGVGRYTAGALLSFAYDKPEALVDGNVVRLLSRVYGITDDVKDPKTQEGLWGLAWKLVPPKGARHFNSALMDLGASVCRPSDPDCLVCPLFKDCWARRQGRQEELPHAGADRPRKKIVFHAALIRHGGAWPLLRRPARGLYAGLWEFPTAEMPEDSPAPQVEAALGGLLGVPVRLVKRLPPIIHILTHREMHLHPWLGDAASPGEKASWRSPSDIDGMAISSLTRKLLRLLPGDGEA